MTNRDKFNGINNDVLADMLYTVRGNDVVCKFCAYTKGDCFGKSCFDGVKSWLNSYRDKFNKISNTELVNILKLTAVGDKCQFCCYTSGGCFGKSCTDGIEMWLSAPCANEPKNPPADKHVDLQNVSENVCNNVNHPSHYTSGKIEVIDFIEDKELGFHLGNAVKYISRAGRKNPDKIVEDLQKAVWYINREIGRLEGMKNDGK